MDENQKPKIKWPKLILVLWNWFAIFYTLTHLRSTAPFAVGVRIYVYALFGVIVATMLFALVMLAFYKVSPYLPKSIQRPIFWAYRRRLRKVAAKMGGLIGFPFLMFVDLELPSVFEEGGMRAVFDKVEEWPDKFKNRAMGAFEQIAEMAKMRREHARMFYAAAMEDERNANSDIYIDGTRYLFPELADEIRNKTELGEKALSQLMNARLERPTNEPERHPA